MTLNYRIDILMLDDIFHISTAEIGVYSVGVALAEKIWLIPDATKDILMSKLSNGSNSEEVAKVTGTNKDDSAAKAPIKRKSAKIGRNDLCPCGSGLKYKQCCGKNA